MSDSPQDRPPRPSGNANGKHGPGPLPGGNNSGKPRPKAGGKVKKGGIWLEQLTGLDFALSHPKCVVEMEPDYQEGMEIWREGDYESARDALRFALQGCGDNLWVHVALGRIALEEDKDPRLARGHFGYAFELAQKAIPSDFRGRLPMDHPANEPLYGAIDGLLACYAAMGEPALGREIRNLARAWSTGGGGKRP